MIREIAAPAKRVASQPISVEKLAMESADTISDIHGGGSPAAHRLTIFRESNTQAKVKAAKRLAGIES